MGYIEVQQIMQEGITSGNDNRYELISHPKRNRVVNSPAYQRRHVNQHEVHDTWFVYLLTG